VILLPNYKTIPERRDFIDKAILFGSKYVGGRSVGTSQILMNDGCVVGFHDPCEPRQEYRGDEMNLEEHLLFLNLFSVW